MSKVTKMVRYFIFLLGLVYLFVGLNLTYFLVYQKRSDIISNPVFTKAIILEVLPESKAASLGLKIGDEIQELNGSSLYVSTRMFSESIESLGVKRTDAKFNETIHDINVDKGKGEKLGVKYTATALDLNAYQLVRNYIRYTLSREQILVFVPMIVLGTLHLALVFVLWSSWAHKKILKTSISLPLAVCLSIVLSILLLSVFQGFTILHLFSLILLLFLVVFDLIKAQIRLAKNER